MKNLDLRLAKALSDTTWLFCQRCIKQKRAITQTWNPHQLYFPSFDSMRFFSSCESSFDWKQHKPFTRNSEVREFIPTHKRRKTVQSIDKESANAINLYFLFFVRSLRKWAPRSFRGALGGGGTLSRCYDVIGVVIGCLWPHRTMMLCTRLYKRVPYANSSSAHLTALLSGAEKPQDCGQHQRYAMPGFAVFLLAEFDPGHCKYFSNVVLIWFTSDEREGKW